MKLTVTFAPTTTGSATGSVAITSSDPKRGTVTVQLKGAGA